MSAWTFLKSLFGGGTAASPDRIYIVDAVGLLGGRQGRASPRDLLALLNRLGRFAGKEKIELQAVLEGEPLHRAPDGEEFNGVTVLYAENPASRPAFILDLLRRALRGSSHVTVITSDPELETRVLESGGHPLRAATFRKALEADGGGETREGGGDGRRGARRRSGRRGGRGGRGRGEGGRKGGGESGPAEQKPPGGDVSDLIDLVE